MLEVERKFRLDKQKADYISDVLDSRFGAPEYLYQVDKAFLYNSQSFKDFKPADPIMRVREVGSTATLTYKRKLGDMGNTVEYEMGISSADTAEAIVKELGYVLAATVKKIRKKYAGDGVVFCLDEVVELGNFLEIEIVCDSAEQIADAEERIMHKAEELGLTESDIEQKKYDQLTSESIENKG